MKASFAIAAAAVVVAMSAPLALAGGGSASKASQGTTFITDTLAPGGGHAAPSQGYRFITDTLAPGGGVPTLAPASAASFDWADAGIGAGVAGGLLLALIGAVLLLTRRAVHVAV